MKKLFGLIIGLSMLLSSAFADEVKVSTYLQGEYVSVKVATEKLASAGFEVVASYASVKDGITIVFTNEALKNEASKPNRAHAAVLRLFVDEKAKTISITNPVYFGKAFMQDDYNAKVFDAQAVAINKAFPNLKGSTDALEFDDLGGYHFMMGMPYYEDSLELGEGKNADLLAKAKKSNVIFEVKLKNSTLLGYELTADTKGFVETIGRVNAGVLPYCVVIEDGKATALHAKYYLAVSYPQLSMGEFMTIATVPGTIEDELAKPFAE